MKGVRLCKGWAANRSWSSFPKTVTPFCHLLFHSAHFFNPIKIQIGVFVNNKWLCDISLHTSRRQLYSHYYWARPFIIFVTCEGVILVLYLFEGLLKEFESFNHTVVGDDARVYFFGKYLFIISWDWAASIAGCLSQVWNEWHIRSRTLRLALAMYCFSYSGIWFANNLVIVW